MIGAKAIESRIIEDTFRDGQRSRLILFPFDKINRYICFVALIVGVLCEIDDLVHPLMVN